MEPLKPLNEKIKNVTMLDSWYMSLNERQVHYAHMLNEMASDPDARYFQNTNTPSFLEDQGIEFEDLNLLECIGEWMLYDPNQKLLAYCIVCGLITDKSQYDTILDFVEDGDAKIIFLSFSQLRRMLGMDYHDAIGLSHQTLVDKILTND